MRQSLFPLALALWTILCGCNAQEVPVGVADEVASVPAPPIPKQEAKPEQPVEKQEAVETLDAPIEAAAEEEQPTQPAVVFESPFPDRVDLFVTPKRNGRGVKESSDGAEDAVELLGFVNVNGQQVLLSINGLVSPLAEGSQESGIEVISIQPPSVVLQRGRQRWQASLAN